jgi:hypothetical protein
MTGLAGLASGKARGASWFKALAMEPYLSLLVVVVGNPEYGLAVLLLLAILLTAYMSTITGWEHQDTKMSSESGWHRSKQAGARDSRKLLRSLRSQEGVDFLWSRPWAAACVCRQLGSLRMREK